jgi:hypothetical protein
MSHYVSPYAYRLPPDTFLSRRDPNWYIGAATSKGPTPDDVSRALLSAHTNAALHEMAKKLDDVIQASFSKSSMVAGAAAVATPGVGLIVFPAFANAVSARKFLTDARDKLVKPGGAAGQIGSTAELALAVIRDKSIPYDEVARRVREFIQDAAKGIDDQIKLNQKSANIFSNTLKAFEEAAAQIKEKLADALLPEDKDIPVWAWAAGGLTAILAIAYITGKVK